MKIDKAVRPTVSADEPKLGVVPDLPRWAGGPRVASSDRRCRMARVLIVDDEKSIRTTLAAFLRAAGYDVETAEDADCALQKLEGADFDVVVTDLILPRKTGVELLQTVRNTAPNVQVVMMTGEPTVETASEAVRAGAVDYLMKPVTKAAIVRCVGHAAEVKAVDDERRRLADVNQVYQTDLERLVQERTKALKNANTRLSRTVEELKQTQQQVIHQERLKALGLMVSGIAHDFNNVLMPIMGLSDLLLSDPQVLEDREEAVHLLQTIRDAAMDGRSIVRRLREFYRPDEKLVTEPVDFREVANTVISLTEPAWRNQAQAEGRHINVTSSLGELPLAGANKYQIREVLTNVLMNAVQAIPGDGAISFSGESDGEKVCIHVTDTGCGMPTEVKNMCFEPFFTTKGEQGTGLGLAVCHGIIERHKGEMRIESEVGRGTTVTIELPAAGEPEPETAPEVPPEPASSLRVLTIDDEEWSRMLLMRFLNAEGHSVEAAQRGAEGLAKLGCGRFDLVITDRAMPEMSGDEVARKVKVLFPKMPVVLLTGFGDLMNDKGERPDGVDLVIGKPVTRLELRGALADVME